MPFEKGNKAAKKARGERRGNRFYFSATDAEAEALRKFARSVGLREKDFVKGAALWVAAGFSAEKFCEGVRRFSDLDMAAPRKRDLAWKKKTTK